MGKDGGKKTINESGTDLEHKGYKYYICEDNCVKTFKEEPEKFTIDLEFLKWDEMNWRY